MEGWFLFDDDNLKTKFLGFFLLLFILFLLFSPVLFTIWMFHDNTCGTRSQIVLEKDYNQHKKCSDENATAHDFCLCIEQTQELLKKNGSHN